MYQPMNNQEKKTYVRRRILGALLKMMQTQPLADISVSALVNAAQVSRASFYRNFTDKEDVLRQENDLLTTQWTESFELEPHKEPNAFFISLLDFYKEHSDFYLPLYRAGLANIVLQTLLAQSEITPEMQTRLPISNLRSPICFMAGSWNGCTEGCRKAVQNLRK